jgi:SAM-dependent methyltransferase
MPASALPPTNALTLSRYADLWLDDPTLTRAILHNLLGSAFYNPHHPPLRALVLGQRTHENPAVTTLLGCLGPGGRLTMIEPCAAPPCSHTQIPHWDTAHLLSAPLDALPLPCASQDAVWSHNLLLTEASLRDPSAVRALMQEILRVLRPGGRAIFCEPEHIYVGRLPKSRLLDLSTARARMRAHPHEADLAQTSLGLGHTIWQHVLDSGLSSPHLCPISAARLGPFGPSDADILTRALPLLGLEPPDEDDAISAFHPQSPFYLLDQPDVLLVQSDWLVCARAPHGA